MRYNYTAEEFKRYEAREYKKAFLIGTDKAWQNYRRNMNRYASKYAEINGVQINLDSMI